MSDKPQDLGELIEALRRSWPERRDLADEIHRVRFRRYMVLTSLFLPVQGVAWTLAFGLAGDSMGDLAMVTVLAWSACPRMVPASPRWRDSLARVPRTHGGLA